MAYFRCTGGGSGATLTLTFSSEFYGQTITATNGTKTVTKVAPSTGTMEITLPESGTWVISCTVSGSTYSTSVEVDLDYTATLEAIPDGSTVLPTDDIQTWLKCAGIRDKTTYTTLADVLADTDTFIALCADSNASDYMARSTTWALAEGSVPTMTSNTTPAGYVASGSHERTGVEPYYQAFDDNYTNGWAAGTGAIGVGEYLDIELPEAICVSKIMLYHYAPANFTTATWELFGSNDGENYTSLRNDIVANQANTKQYYTIESSTKYKYFRMKDIQGANYNNQTAFITELQLYEADITTNSTAMLIVGKYNYCAKALLGNSTWASAICNSTYASSVVSALVPTMTSATTPSGVASSKDVYTGGYEAYKAFDGNSSTQYIAAEGTDTKWLQYQSVEKICVNKIIIYSSDPLANIKKNIARYELVGSDDGTTWSEPIATLSTDDITSGSMEFIVGNKDAYTYHRVNEVKKVSYGIGYHTVQFYGRTEKGYTGTVIHSAVEDTTYYVSGGSNVPFCTIASGDTETVLASTIESLKNQTITLYSSVAKDPTNLSNDYSKQIRITPNVTEIYLMPDFALYWYGAKYTDITPSNYKPWWTSAVFSTPTMNMTYKNYFSATLGANQYGDVFFLNTPTIRASDITFNLVAKADASGMDNAYSITHAYQNNFTYSQNAGEYATPNATTMTKYSVRYNSTEADAIPFFYVCNGTLNTYALWYE